MHQSTLFKRVRSNIPAKKNIKIIEMKITVRVKDIEIVVDEGSSDSIIKYETTNKELHKTIEKMCLEVKKLML
jgi:hypothetical protein